MISRYSVKKPFTVLVGVLLVIYSVLYHLAG